MLFNIFLSVSLVGSLALLWRRMSEKIPELVAIPDDVIVARLHEDSARVRIFLLHVRTFWREPRYRRAFWRFLEKICYRTHIVFLKMDNGLMALVKKSRAHAGEAIAETLFNSEQQQQEDQKSFEAVTQKSVGEAYIAPPLSPYPSLVSMREPRVSATRPAPARTGARVQEVRRRRIKKTITTAV
jgi:hypothetical protein